LSLKTPSLAIVIASNRPDSLRRWFDAWSPLIGSTDVYVIEDAPQCSPGISRSHHHFYSWAEIDDDLGTSSWIIPRRTSAIKSYGFLKAFQDGHDYIWTLDDDCFPETDGNRAPYVHTLKHILGMKQADDSWYNTIESTGLYPRGYPYGIRQEKKQVMIHHGLWSGVPDLDGITALEHHALRLEPVNGWDLVPAGQMFPMCGMNLAFRAEMAPVMYFGLQGHQWKPDGTDPVLGDVYPLPFDRFDDIWAGLFAKKVCDHLGYAVTSGGPSILHTKESDPSMRVTKEAPGIASNELLWRVVAGADISEAEDAAEAYRMLADEVVRGMRGSSAALPADYWPKLAEAMHLWTEQFYV
jgi:reversibly glycosylated polypeptide / UDP-arabinopyranose mutase